ncbi:MAG TPA: serine hydrolase domain-containing protein [Herpetosiphonaceae bacterium]|nr:serine hydrolase domain-containing protein [Herpetosiphonaceae bacterium]
MSVQRADRGFATSFTRRDAIAMGLTLAGGTLAAASARPAFTTPVRQSTPVAGARGDDADAIVGLARDIMDKQDVKAVIVRVTIDGQDIVTEALGESMTGVPATTDMHFRNGAVAISYMSTLLLQLVDQNVVTLDDPLATWLPDLPDADRVTLRMLANMTAGYPDFVQNPRLDQMVYADPFRQWTPEEQIEIGLSTPRVFAPGTNWDYSHTNYVILGQALEKITGEPLEVALQEKVLGPMGLRNTVAWSTPEISNPVLHAFTSERRQALGIPAGTRFYEESTYWNPSWTLAKGAIQTTDIVDMTASAVAIGEGTLLSPASHQAQIAPDLLGFGTPVAGCPNCHTLDETYSYGLGVVLSGDWIVQNPLFAGYGGVMAYLPTQKIAIAVATTFDEGAFDEQGNYKYSSHAEIFAAIGTHLAPDHPLPTPTA